MSEDRRRTQILEVLQEIAPEVDAAALDPARSFRDQFDFDSVDFLNFALALEKKLGVKIPEVDYPKLGSLDGCAEYLAGKTGE